MWPYKIVLKAKKCCQRRKYKTHVQIRSAELSRFIIPWCFLQTEMSTVWKLELLKTFDELLIYFSHIIYIYIYISITLFFLGAKCMNESKEFKLFWFWDLSSQIIVPVIFCDKFSEIPEETLQYPTLLLLWLLVTFG